MNIIPIGYQGAAKHTWTAHCDGLHEASCCPPVPVPPYLTTVAATTTVTALHPSTTMPAYQPCCQSCGRPW